MIAEPLKAYVKEFAFHPLVFEGLPIIQATPIGHREVARRSLLNWQSRVCVLVRKLLMVRNISPLRVYYNADFGAAENCVETSQ